jgi:hypothetical protein
MEMSVATTRLQRVQISRRRPRLREGARDEALAERRVLAYGSLLEETSLTDQTREVDVVETRSQRLGPGQIIGVRGEAQIANAGDHHKAPAAT